LPRVAVGHSLFGQVSLAYQAQAAATDPVFSALALLGVNVWIPEFEPWRFRLWIKRLSFAAGMAVSRPFGYLPVRRLRLGTADEPYPYLAQMGSWLAAGDWLSRDGTSYFRALPRLRVPILSVAGAGDFLLGVPACQLRTIAKTSGPITH